MSVPPNTLAALSIWGTVWLSTKYKMRAPFIIAAGAVAILGKQHILVTLNLLQIADGFRVYYFDHD